MSIERDYKEDTYAAVCDECHDVIVEDCETFHEAVEGVKSHGGRLKPGPRGQWSHYCADCREEID